MNFVNQETNFEHFKIASQLTSNNSAEPLNVAVFGLGHVGLISACCIAAQGHKVVGVDTSLEKTDLVNSGLAPFTEPGLDELLEDVVSAGVLSASVDPRAALKSSDLIIVCVGTPSAPDGQHDMSYIADVSVQIAQSLLHRPQKKVTVAFRSTVRPGTMDGLIAQNFQTILGPDFKDWVELVYHPEFMREAQAINDYYDPPKIVFGTHDGSPSETMDRLYSGCQAKVFYTNFAEAEFTKFVDNAWHGTKVAFANEIGQMCERLNISANTAHEMFVADTKLNVSARYLRPGGPFGGSCLPKDIRALQSVAKEVGANTPLVDSLITSNEAHKDHQLDQVLRAIEPRKPVLLVGLAFKANTSDVRESPNCVLAERLIAHGVQLSIYDASFDQDSTAHQNAGTTACNIADLGHHIISKQETESADWGLIVVANDTFDSLDFSGNPKIINIHCIG
ncbi:MAG: nucleotide sugar dehydrogenase [Hyphomicrobiales bacterium]